MKATLFFGVAIIAVSGPLVAHEYWLDPFDSSVATGDSAIIDVRNGQDFNGAAFPYDPDRLETVTINGEDSSRPYTGRLGDYPAIHPAFDENGLYSINLATVGTLLTYDSWDKFNGFLEYHGFNDVAKRHEERGLPKSDVTERYYRSAKTIIQVSELGDLILDEKQFAGVEDHKAFASTGTVFEMLLLDNPYSKIDSIRIKLLFDSKPVADRQAEMFWKDDTFVRVTAVTNADGIATFKLLGEGDYLLNAVEVKEPEDDKVNWLSYWASVTFER